MTDLKKRTSKLPKFHPSVAGTHLIAQMRHNQDPLYQCGASLLESHEKMEQHIEWLSHEILELSRVHNAVVDIAISTAAALKVSEERELVNSTEKKTNKAWHITIAACVASVGTSLLSWIFTKF